MPCPLPAIVVWHACKHSLPTEVDCDVPSSCHLHDHALPGSHRLPFLRGPSPQSGLWQSVPACAPALTGPTICSRQHRSKRRRGEAD